MPVVAVLDPGAHAGGALLPKSTHPEKESSMFVHLQTVGALAQFVALASFWHATSLVVVHHTLAPSGCIHITSPRQFSRV